MNLLADYQELGQRAAHRPLLWLAAIFVPRTSRLHYMLPGPQSSLGRWRGKFWEQNFQRSYRLHREIYPRYPVFVVALKSPSTLILIHCGGGWNYREGDWSGWWRPAKWLTRAGLSTLPSYRREFLARQISWISIRKWASWPNERAAPCWLTQSRTVGQQLGRHGWC